MPKVDAYISQRGLPTSTNIPQVPLALGSYAPIIQGAEQAAHDTTYLFTLLKYRENRMEEVEQTNYAALVLGDARQQVLTEMDKAHDPKDDIYSGLSYSDRKKAFTGKVNEIGQAAIQGAARRGNIAGNYAATHFPVYIASQVEKFYGQMDVARREQAKFELVQTTQGSFENAVTAVSQGEFNYHLDLGRQRLKDAVNAGLLTSEEAITQLKTLEGARLERLARRWEGNYTEYLNARPQLANIPGIDITKLDTRIVEAENRRNGLIDRQRTEANRLYAESADKTRVEVESAIAIGQMTTPADLNKYVGLQPDGSFRTPFKPEDYTRAVAQIESVQMRGGVPSDLVVVDQFNKALASLDPRKWPSESKLDAAVQTGTLSVADAGQMRTRLRTNLKEAQDSRTKDFDDSVRQAHDHIKYTYAAMKTGLFANFTTDIAQAENSAYIRLDEMVRLHKNDATKGLPTQWAQDIVNATNESLSVRGKEAWKREQIVRGLPAEVRQYDTLEKLNKAYDGGSPKSKISKEHFLLAYPWVKALESIAVGAKERPTPKTDLTGRE